LIPFLEEEEEELEEEEADEAPADETQCAAFGILKSDGTFGSLVFPSKPL
jgi:hypothetical protein